MSEEGERVERYDGYRAQVVVPLQAGAETRMTINVKRRWHEAAGALPGCRLIDLETDLAQDVAILTYEGDRLPPWMRATPPISFDSFERVRRYRQLRAIYDIRWPDDIRRSTHAVEEVMRHAGQPVRVLRRVRSGEQHVVSWAERDYMSLVVGPRAVSDAAVDWSNTTEEGW